MDIMKHPELLIGVSQDTTIAFLRCRSSSTVVSTQTGFEYRRRENDFWSSSSIHLHDDASSQPRPRWRVAQPSSADCSSGRRRSAGPACARLRDGSATHGSAAHGSSAHGSAGARRRRLRPIARVGFAQVRHLAWRVLFFWRPPKGVKGGL